MSTCDFGENESNLICLSNDLKKLLFDDQYSDWTLICEGEKIPCHRNLIASRSPVFKRMIDQSGFDEHSKRQSEIKDMNVSTLKSLLTFIYTNKVVSDNIPDLFAMADMYDIQVQKTFLQS